MKFLNLLVNTLFFWRKDDSGPRNQVGGVVGLSLVRSGRGNEVAKLRNGTKIYLNNSDADFTIVATTSASTSLLRGVQFDWNGRSNYKTDRTIPYSLCGDDYAVCITLQDGTHRITATALNGMVPYQVEFTILKGTVAPTLSPNTILAPPPSTRNIPPPALAPVKLPVAAPVSTLKPSSAPVPIPVSKPVTRAPVVVKTPVASIPVTPPMRAPIVSRKTLAPTAADTLAPSFSETSLPTSASSDSFGPTTALPTSLSSGTTLLPTTSDMLWTAQPTAFDAALTAEPSVAGSVVEGTMVPTAVATGTEAPSIESTVATVLPTIASTGATIVPTIASTGATIVPTIASTGATILPTIASMGATIVPTMETTKGTFAPTVQVTQTTSTSAPVAAGAATSVPTSVVPFLTDDAFVTFAPTIDHSVDIIVTGAPAPLVPSTAVPSTLGSTTVPVATPLQTTIAPLLTPGPTMLATTVASGSLLPTAVRARTVAPSLRTTLPPMLRKTLAPTAAKTKAPAAATVVTAAPVLIVTPTPVTLSPSKANFKVTLAPMVVPVSAAPVAPAPTKAPVVVALPVSFAPVTNAPISGAPMTATPTTLAPATEVPVSMAPTKPLGFQPILINCGGEAYIDKKGRLWVADSFSEGGFPYYKKNVEVYGTEDDAIYNTERYGHSFYYIPVPSGVYTVVLHFAEIYHKEVGKRVFDIDVEGREYNDVDIVALGNGEAFKAVTIVVKGVIVKDGTLTLKFLDNEPRVDFPKISAIEINLGSPSPPTVAPAAVPMPTQLPVVVPMPTQLPVVAPMPTQLPVVAPMPTQLPAVVPMPTQLPVVVPMPTQLPAVVPLPTQLPVVVPMPTQLPVVVPLPTQPPVVTLMPTLTPTRTAAFETILIRCGRDTPYTDSQGRLWSADKYFDGGNQYGDDGKVISGTTDNALYTAERWGVFAYKVPVPKGNFLAILHFAEIYHQDAGKRVFDVNVEGVEYPSFDIVQQGGGISFSAILLETPVTVTDGILTIELTNPQVDNPKLSAIEIRSDEEQ